MRHRTCYRKIWQPSKKFEDMRKDSERTALQAKACPEGPEEIEITVFRPACCQRIGLSVVQVPFRRLAPNPRPFRDQVTP